MSKTKNGTTKTKGFILKIKIDNKDKTTTTYIGRKKTANTKNIGTRKLIRRLYQNMKQKANRQYITA